MKMTEEWDQKEKAAHAALQELTELGDRMADYLDELEGPQKKLHVFLNDEDMPLLHALASTAGTTPEDLASRYLAGRITVEARQLVGGGQ